MADTEEAQKQDVKNDNEREKRRHHNWLQILEEKMEEGPKAATRQQGGDYSTDWCTCTGQNSRVESSSQLVGIWSVPGLLN